MGKYFSIPNLFNKAPVIILILLLLQLLNSDLSSLDEHCSYIVQPLCSLFVCFCFQIKATMNCLNGEAHGVELLWDFVAFHDFGAQSQNQICDFSDLYKARLLFPIRRV